MEQDESFPWALSGTILLTIALALWWTFATPPAASDEAADETEQARHPDGPDRPVLQPVAAPPALDAAPRASVSGTVRDERGRPISGARVCATPSLLDLEGHDPGFPTCAMSGADGRYGIDGLWPVPTAVDASAKGFRPGRWSERRATSLRPRTQLPLRAGETVEDVDIELASGGVLVQGTVQDISGGVVAGAHVAVGSGRWFATAGSSHVLTDESGRFEAWSAPGDIFIQARADGYASGRFSAVAPGEFVEVFLTPESVLIGEVVDAETGRPIAGALVQAPLGGSPWSFGGGGGSARTDDEGQFRIAGLEPGSYKPEATSADRYAQAPSLVHLGLGQTSEPVTLRAHPASLVEGLVVVAGEERPCPFGSVRLDSKTAGRKQGDIDEEGLVRIEGVLPGTYQVTVRCNGFIAADDYPDLEVAAAPLTGLRWEVEPGLSIRGQVVDARGQPLEEVRLVARQVLDEDQARGQRTSASGSSREDGSFELTGLQPGRYELDVFGWGERPGPDEPVALDLEDRDVEGVLIELPEVGRLVGRVVDERGEPVSGASIIASTIDFGQSRGRGRSNDAGEFVIEELQPGETRVYAQEAGFGEPMRAPGRTDDDEQGEVVTVAAGETTDVQLVVVRQDASISGTVVDEDGGPVIDAFVSAERISERTGSKGSAARSGVRWGWNERPVLTDQDGSFRLEGLAEGSYVVRAFREGGGEAVEDGVQTGTNAKLTIASTGKLGGKITAGGKAPERFSVTAIDREQLVARSDDFFRTGGRFELSELPPGTYEIAVTSPDGTDRQEGVVLGKGEERLDLSFALSGRVTLRGRVVDAESGKPVAGMTVEVSSREGGRFSFGLRNGDKERKNVTDTEGRFVVEEAPVGRVNVVVVDRKGAQDSKYSYSFLPRAVEPEPTEQDLGDVKIVASRIAWDAAAGDLGFTLEEDEVGLDVEARELVVALVRDDGPAAESGLAPGDVIEKVDGIDVSGPNSGRWYQVSRVEPGTKLTFTLRDGEAPITITTGPPR